METKLMDKQGNEKGSISLADNIFNVKPNKYFLYEIVKYYLANKRVGTASTKTRSEVRGGGRKPWRQKGTGRARQGTIRSPLWKGGGVVFGPKPRDYSLDMPEKKLKLALKQMLSARASENKIYVLDEISLEAPKTKDFKKILENLKIKDDEKVLVVLDELNDILKKSMRNLENVVYTRASDVNAYDIITNDVILMNQKALDIINKRLEA